MCSTRLYLLEDSLAHLPALALRFAYPSSALSLLLQHLSSVTIRNMSGSILPDEKNSQALPAKLSRLCDKCKILLFNDAGFVVEEGGLLEPGDPVFFINLDYDQWDVLPDLPRLEAFAADGCAFCAALRDATMSLRIGNAADVQFKLEYSWGVEDSRGDLSEVGLYLLTVSVAVTPKGNDGLRPSEYMLVFSIESEGE